MSLQFVGEKALPIPTIPAGQMTVVLEGSTVVIRRRFNSRSATVDHPGVPEQPAIEVRVPAGLLREILDGRVIPWSKHP